MAAAREGGMIVGQKSARWRWQGGLLALLVTLLVLSGCAPKVQVTYHARQRPAVQAPQVAADQGNILLLKRHYEKWRGTPYVDGGMSPTGIDCSGYTVLAYRDLFGVKLPRTALEQADSGWEIPRHNLRSGDLVFFNTGRNTKHVGIYLHNDQFVHASLSRGVALSSLDDPYWQERYWHSRRPAANNGQQGMQAARLSLASNRQ
jgi:cell wall-associated NlpC family hydrolase